MMKQYLILLLCCLPGGETLSELNMQRDMLRQAMMENPGKIVLTHPL